MTFASYNMEASQHRSPASTPALAAAENRPVVIPAMAGIAATGITKLLETNIGDKLVHHTANRTRKDTRHLHNDEFGQKKNHSKARSNSTHSRSSQNPSSSTSSSDKPNPEKSWSRKSYWRSSHHQQKAPSPSVWHSSSDSEGDGWSRKSYWRSKRHQQEPLSPIQHPSSSHHPHPPQYQAYTGALSRDEQQEREKRRETFREMKNRYVPPTSKEEESRRGSELHWDEERLYADVGEAVREATRRSSSVGRERPGREMRGGHM